MATLKKQYRDLEMKVMANLRDKVINSKISSKHLNCNCIKVNVFGYTELVIVSDQLTFIDNKGLHYSLFSDANLEDLIDIINEN